MSLTNSILFSWPGLLIVGLIILFLGLYSILSFRNLLKIFLGIEIISKAIIFLFVGAGFMNGKLALAESFVIFYIVIEVVIATVLLGLIVHTYQNYGTLDIRSLKRLKG